MLQYTKVQYLAAREIDVDSALSEHFGEFDCIASFGSRENLVWCTERSNSVTILNCRNSVIINSSELLKYY